MRLTSRVTALWLLLSLAAPQAPAAAQTATAPAGFALLVGVDNYAQPPNVAARISNLKGPANDVALMRALLVDKYGFAAGGNNIVTLVGKQATVAAIRDSVRSHLIENAKKYPEAKIVFYFSGHGSTTDDQDGDEGDGKDETLVAYDSRLPDGADIVDDEIEKWLAPLGTHRGNVTVIFDSCHSGSATKDIGKSAATARGVPPNPNIKLAGARVAAKGGAAKNGMLHGKGSQTFVSGSLPWELSNEGQVLDENGKAVYRGFLTHYLVARLRQQPTLTYAELVEAITPDIAQHVRSQHPQADGNARVPFLGNAGDARPAYLKILSAAPGKNPSIAAGEMHGLGVGALLAVYAGDIATPVGETGKLANARAVKVSAGTSEIELLSEPSRALSTADKVAIVTPYFGRYRLAFLYDQLLQQAASGEDKKVLAGIKAMLKDDLLVQAGSTQKWAAALRRGCVHNGKLIVASGLDKVPANCRRAYYVVTPPDLDNPLMVFPQTPGDVVPAGQRIATYLSLKARQDNLRLLDNLQTPLKDKLGVTLVWQGKQDSGAAEQEFAADQTARLAIDDVFELKLTNHSDRDLYVTVLAMGSSGNTTLYSASQHGDLIKAGASMRAKPAFKAGLPYGFETYKVFATTRAGVDFSVLESGSTRKAAGNSAFEMMLEDYSNVNSRDVSATAKQSVNLDEWVTAKVNAEIVP